MLIGLPVVDGDAIFENTRHFRLNFGSKHLVELPVSLNEEDHHTFSVENKPLPENLIQQFIRPYEKEDMDEFTEYVPCFRLPKTKEYVGIVFWRAKLMDYHYMLHTYKKNGEFIQAIHIAGIRSDGDTMARLFCTIKDLNTIQLVAGSADIGQKDYEAQESKAFLIELDDNGMADIEMDESLNS